MNNLIKLSFLFSSILLLTACASAGSQTRILSSSPPPQIAYAPPIDVSYDEVLENVGEHVGVNVRWGGQVIRSEEVASGRRLTVFAYPLNGKGKPIKNSRNGPEGGRFVVELDGDSFEGEQLEQRFITVYGTVSGGFKLTNGPKEKIIPVVDALKTTEWGSRYRRHYDNRGYAYYDLGFRFGHYGHYYGYPRFGHRFSYYPRRAYRRHHRRHHYH